MAKTRLQATVVRILPDHHDRTYAGSFKQWLLTEDPTGVTDASAGQASEGATMPTGNLTGVTDASAGQSSASQETTDATSRVQNGNLTKAWALTHQHKRSLWNKHDESQP